MPLDPTTPTHDDHYEEQPRRDAAERAGSGDEPMTESGEVPIRALLWTAATYRPLEEVAALVMLLKRTGEVPNPGDEALRVAAVARPIDEVMQLVAMLNEPPHEIDEADTTLRAAAVGRPIEEVAQLVSYLGTLEHEPPFATAHRKAERGEPAPTLFDHLDESGPRDAYSGLAEPVGRTARFPHDAEPQRVAPWTSAPAGPPPEVPRLAPAADRRSAGPRARTVSAALRSPLRLPAAAALFACGVIHLPTDFAGLRSGGYADAVALVVTVLCLVFGLLLAVADSARIWAASAATAVGIIAAHTVSGLGTVDLLQSGVSADFAWASLAAMGCAAVTLVLAGTALTLRQRTAQKAPRRSSPASRVANDA